MFEINDGDVVSINGRKYLVRVEMGWSDWGWQTARFQYAELPEASTTSKTEGRAGYSSDISRIRFS